MESCTDQPRAALIGDARRNGEIHVRRRLTNEELSGVYEKHADTVYRIALMMLKNTADAEDITQSVFIKLLNASIEFEEDERLKAWLIVVTQNACRDLAKSWWRTKRADNEGVRDEMFIQTPADRDIWDKVAGLHEKYKLPIYLYYFEGYDTAEISRILKVNHSTVRTRMRAAKKKLKIMLDDDLKDEDLKDDGSEED